jgi:hypothetical protein
MSSSFAFASHKAPNEDLLGFSMIDYSYYSSCSASATSREYTNLPIPTYLFSPRIITPGPSTQHGRLSFPTLLLHQRLRRAGPRRFLVVQDIAKTTRHIALPSGQPDAIDATEKIIIPGFIDTHRHVLRALFKGMMGDWTLAAYIGEEFIGARRAPYHPRTRTALPLSVTGYR